jgi:hypothetical protein
VINTKSSTIVELLMKGKNSKEIITMGYKPGTVFAVQRGWRLGKAKSRSESDTLVPITNHAVASNSYAEIESEAGAPPLHKEYSQGGLEEQSESLKLQLDMKILIASAYDIGKTKYGKCPDQENGVCRFWQWPNVEEIPQGIGQPVKGSKGGWRIKPSPLYCAMCTESIEKDVDDLIGDTIENPLFGIRDKGRCECGARGEVEVYVKCKKCGKDSWWGG